jgi:nitrite reductase/ring-hydroxylating ferredoxin subunit
MAEFIRVAGKSDLASGEGRVIEIDGRPIALFNVSGEYYALDNTCMHRGGPLGEGFVDCANLTVQCPWHGWVYGLATGASSMNPMARVEKFEVRIDGEDVMVSLG